MAVSSFNAVKKSKHFLVVLNITFAVIAVVGQVGQNVSLPLWTGATGSMYNPNCSNTSSNSSMDILEDSSNVSNSSYQPQMDPFFVLSFASLSFVVIFGITTAVLVILQLTVNTIKGEQFFSFITLKDDILFPQWQLILIGVFDALNGVFVVFASMPSRTAPFLQAILGNFTIPLTIFFRLLILRKKPTLLKLLCAIAVLLGLILSLIPNITGLDEDSKSGNNLFLKQSRLSQILWPLCFMFGFIPAAVMNVIEEMSLKDTRKVNLFYLLFWTSSYQLITVLLLFWVDIIPHFGFAHSARDFGENYKFAVHCFFGGSGCDYQPGLSGTIFISMYVVSYIGGGLLLRYSEGATYLAVVQSLVTPLGAVFWSIFSQDGCARFIVHPHAGTLTYFSIGGMVIMVPAIFLYNIGTFEALKKIFVGGSDSKEQIQYEETTPLIKSPPSYKA